MLGERGRIAFRDEHVAADDAVVLLIDRLEISALDSAAPATRNPLTLSAGLGSYGRIELGGHISALDPLIDTQLKGSVLALPLPLISSYAETLVGYELQSGQFDHEFDVAIENQQINATNEIKLRKTKIAKAQGVKAQAPLPIPLDLALNMLRDNKDNIKLSVPLKGALDDPKVGVDQIVSTALRKALTAGSTTYLKLALQPYGAIWMGAEMGLKLAGKMRLDPMPFDPMQPQMAESQLDYAAKLATLMTERPKLELTIRGAAGEADYAAYREALIAEAEANNAAATPSAAETQMPSPAFEFPLEEHTQFLRSIAKKRAAALKQELVANHGISDQRIYVGKATAESSEKLSGVKMEL